MAYRIGDWESFALAQVGASAALLGLVFVGISINLRDIVGSGSLVHRAGEAVILLGSILAVATVVLIPGAPLVPILFLSQALNAVLLLVLLPFMRRIARDPEVMGTHAMTGWDRVLTGAVLALVAVSVVALFALTVA